MNPNKMRQFIPAALVPSTVWKAQDQIPQELIPLLDRPWHPCAFDSCSDDYNFFDALADRTPVQCLCTRCATKEDDYDVELYAYEIPYGSLTCPVLIGQCSKCERTYYVSNPGPRSEP